MKYFIDTEFIEGFYKPLFGKKRHFIDLISIGIVCEDGREYYAISNEFNPKDASQWVKDNVIFPIELDLFKKLNSDEKKSLYYKKGLRAFRNLQAKFGKSNKQIAEDIMLFCGREVIEDKFGNGHYVYPEDIQFYAYYADYDWVLFCSLFGTMMDLPKGFPMYCIDLKQHLDYMLYNSSINYHEDILGELNPEKDRSATIQEKLAFIKTTDKYPKQKNEHNALEDAKWNYELCKFMEGI